MVLANIYTPSSSRCPASGTVLGTQEVLNDQLELQLNFLGILS